MKRGLNIAGQLSFRHQVSPENLLTNLYHLTAFAVQRYKLVNNDSKSIDIPSCFPYRLYLFDFLRVLRLMKVIVLCHLRILQKTKPPMP